MQSDFFLLVCIHFPLIFSVLFSYIVLFFFLLRFSSCYLFACSVLTIVLLSLYVLSSLPLTVLFPTFPFYLPFALFMYLCCNSSCCPSSIILTLILSGASLLQSYPVIAPFVFKLTFHGYTQPNTSKNTCTLHKESEDFK